MKNIPYIDNMEEWKKGFSFSIPIKVRFSETDSFGHLNNTVAFVYFEEARVEFFKALGFMQKWTDKESDIIPVVSDLTCNYLKQVLFDESLKTHIKIAGVGITSAELHYMVTNSKEEIVLTGRGRVVQVSKKSGRPVKWSDDMQQEINQFISTGCIIS